MKQMIKEQLTMIYNGDPWYGGSMFKVLNSVNPKFIFDKPEKNMHSIAELVTHIYMYRKFAEERLQGSTDRPPEQEGTFDWQCISYEKNLFWQTAVEELKRNQQKLSLLLEQADDELFVRRVPGKSYTFQYLLTGIIQHDLYHLGQIVYINKLLSNKKSRAKLNSSNYDYRIFSFENMAMIK